MSSLEGFEFILMRHAESVNNRSQREALLPGLFSRVPDPPLTPRGKQQAQEAAARLRPLVGETAIEVFTSDMTRTIETAMHLAKGLGAASSTRVCVVPVPFFSEMGTDTVVEEPLQARFAETARECGACLDGSLWRGAWDDSQRLAGDYEACLPRFLAGVMPWIVERCRRRRRNKGALPVVIGHGQYMRQMLGVWRRFHNAEAVRCRCRGDGGIEIVERLR